MISPLSTSYADARSAFLDAAAATDARIESFPHPLGGLEGEPLFVDVAEVGPDDADDVVVIVSGTHGVEGYLGSALQRHHLETEARDRRADPALIFVHALNPHGFSWVRRVNEDNVDLNRNFIDWSAPHPANDDYGDLAETLVPASWSEEDQTRTLGVLMSKLETLGLERVQQIISGGQYEHPNGLFYGGTGPTWSNRWLHEFFERRLGTARRIAIVDLHTGLGPWGHGELISSAAPGEAELDRQRSWWDDVTSLHDGSSVSAELAGEWLGAVAAIVPSAEVTGIAIEYGTVDPITVMQSLPRRRRVARIRRPGSTGGEDRSGSGPSRVHRRRSGVARRLLASVPLRGHRRHRALDLNAGDRSISERFRR